METFNDALMAKQPSSLVARLLSARYFPDGDIFSASLGARPSYTWRCLFGARDVILQGSSWLVGNGHSLNIWRDRWLPHPRYFKPITPCGAPYESYKVSDLIDFDNSCWRESLVRLVFLPCDANLILSLPLCES